MPDISQIDLIAAIAKHLAKQGVGLVSPRHMNSIIKAATLIVDELAVDDRPSVAGEGLDAWLRSDDTGLPSLTMASTLAPLAGLHHVHCSTTGHPHDGSDFGRCVRLLDAVPELKEHLPAMKAVDKVWSGMVDRWDEMEAIYCEDLPKGKSQRLFRIIASIIHASKA